MPKRDQNLNIRLSFKELQEVKTAAYTMDISDSELVRICICLAIPQLEKIEYLRRLHLEDNVSFKDVSKT